MKILKLVVVLMLVMSTVIYAGGEDVLKVAKEKLDNKEYKEAVKILQGVVKKHKDLYEAYYMLGKAYYYLEDYREAKKNLEKSKELKGDFVGTYLILGNIAEKEGDLEGAEELIQEAIKLKPKNSELKERLGDIYAEGGKNNEAIKMYIESYKEDKKRVKAAFKAIQIYMDNKNYKTALEVLEKIEDEVEGDENEATYERLKEDSEYNLKILEAEELYRKGKIEDSLDKYEEAKEIKGWVPELEVKIAECHYKLNEIEEAEDIIKEILKKDRNNSGALRLKGRILYRGKKYKEAKEWIKKAIENEEDGKDKSKEYYILGMIEEKLGNIAEAKESYKEAVKIDGSNYKAYMRLGIMNGNDKRYEESIKNLNMALEKVGKEEKKDREQIEKLLKKVKSYYHIDKGNKAFDRRAYREAIKEYTAAEAEEKGNKVAIVNKANALIAMKRYKEAIKELGKIKGKFVPAYISKARAYKKMKKNKEAEKIYKEMKKMQKDNWEMYYETGVFYEQNRKYKKAIKEYKTGKKLAKGEDGRDKINRRISEVYYILGRKSMYKRKFKEAKRYLEKANKYLKNQPKVERAIAEVKDLIEWEKINMIMGKGNKLYSRGKYKEAIKLYKEILKIREVREAEYMLGQAYYEWGKIEEADEVMEKHVRKNKGYIEGIELYTKIKIEKGEYSKAEQVLKDSEEEVKEGREGRDKIYYYLGMIYEKEGRRKEAIGSYKKAIRINPKNYDARIMLGNLYYKGKEYTKAEQEYKFILKRDPRNDVALYNLGYIYYKKNKLDVAYKIFKRAEKLIKGFAPLYFNIGRILYYKKAYKEAYKYLKEAIRLSKEEKIGYKWGLANIYVRLYQQAKGGKVKKGYRESAKKLLEECIYNKKDRKISALARAKILEVQPNRKYLYEVQYEIGKKYIPQIVENIIYYYDKKTGEVIKRYKETGEKIWGVKVKGGPICQYKVGAENIYIGLSSGEVLEIEKKEGKIRNRIEERVREIEPYKGGVILLSKDSREIYYYEGGKKIWEKELGKKGGEKNNIEVGENILFYNNEKIIKITGEGKEIWEYKGKGIKKAEEYKDMIIVEEARGKEMYVKGIEKSGKEKWKIKVKTGLKEKPYFSLNYIVLVLKDNSIIVSDKGGRIKWRKKNREAITSVIVKEDVVIVADKSEKIRSYLVSNGKQLWAYKIRSERLKEGGFYTIYYQ